MPWPGANRRDAFKQMVQGSTTPPKDWTEADWAAFCRQLDLKNFKALAEGSDHWRSSAQDFLTAAEVLCSAVAAADQRVIQRMMAESDDSKKRRAAGEQLPESTSRILEGQELEDHMMQQSRKVVLLLYGLAIENLLKGRIIRREQLTLQADKFQLKTHDLVKLAERSAFSPTGEQRQVLHLLTKYVKWLGKYSIPLSGDEYLEHCTNRGMNPRPMADFREKVHDLIRAIVGPPQG